MSRGGLYKERKFCGNDGMTEDKDEVSLLVQAFMHHVVVDSHGQYLLTDLQGTVFLSSFLTSSVELIVKLGVVYPPPNWSIRLYDPQAHTYVNLLSFGYFLLTFCNSACGSAKFGHGNRGKRAIKDWLSAHSCTDNNYCKALGLHRAPDPYAPSLPEASSQTSSRTQKGRAPNFAHNILQSPDLDDV